MIPANPPRTEETIRLADLWVIRLYYFALVGGAGFISPFLNLFYARQGLSGEQIGWVAGVGSLVAIIAAPLWTRQVNSSAHPRRLLQGSTLLYGLLFLWIGQQTRFLWIAALTAVRVLVTAGISPLSDALAVRVANATRAGYGSIRVWGSLGWAVFALASGWLMERLGIKIGFVGVTIAMLVGALLLFGLDMPMLQPSAGRPTVSGGFRQASRLIARNPVLVGLALMYLFIGIANAGVSQFETIYLSQLGAREGLIGVAGMVSSVVELAGMLWADRLISRKGPARILMLAMLMNAGLRASVFFFPGVATIIAARAAGGISFSMYTVAIVRLIVEQTPPEETATTLALFTVTLVSTIGFLGNPIAGFLFDRFGPHWLYPISVIGYLLAWTALRLTRAAPIVETVPGT
ncbi:MAG TPA: MFS transporter [Anaerolineaceae bacterium]